MSNTEIVHRAAAAFNRGDLEGTLADVAPEFEYVTAGTIPDLSGTYRGTERFEAFVRRFWEGFEEARLDVHEVVEGEDGRVMVAMTMSGRGKQSDGGDQLGRLSGLDHQGRQGHPRAGLHEPGGRIRSADIGERVMLVLHDPAAAPPAQPERQP